MTGRCKRRIALVACLGALAVLCVLACMQRGLPYELWQIHRLDAEDPGDRQAATDALLAMRSARGGEAIVDHLIAEGCDPPEWAGLLHTPPRAYFYRRDADKEARCLLWIGAIERLGAVAGREVEPWLQAESSTHRQWAAWLLGWSAERGARALPALLPLLDDRDPSVRQYAAAAVGSVGRCSSSILAPCLATLVDERRSLAARAASLKALDIAVRLSPAQAAGELRIALREALLQVLSSTDVTLRRLALEQLVDLARRDPGDSKTVLAEIVQDALSDPEPRVRQLAVQHLALLQPLRGPALAAYGKLLADEVPDVRAAAFGQVDVLVRSLDGAAEPEAFAVVAEALRQDERRDRLDDAAREALRAARTDELLWALVNGDRAHRIHAAVLLGQLASRPEISFPALLRAADDEDPAVQAEALRGCCNVLRGEERALVQKAVELLKITRSYRVRYAAVRAIDYWARAAHDLLADIRELEARELDPGLREELGRLAAKLAGGR